MKLSAIILLLFVSFTAVAQAAFLYDPVNVFEVQKLSTIQGETIYGVLDNAPHTFTFFIREQTEFSVQVSISGKQKVQDVSLILVKQEKHGVSEVGRLEGKRSEWVIAYDPVRAVTFAEGSELVYTLDSGTYKLEVSSPENNRGYRLVIGEGNPSVFQELFMVRTVFGLSVFSVIFSTYSIGLFLIGMLFIGYRKYKKYVS